jgi:hypothetical protein
MIIKEFIYQFLTNLININIFFLKKFSKNKYIYSKKISFGDTFTFFIENFYKIKNKKIIIFSKLEEKISKLIFPEEKIKKILFLIPSFIPTYRISYLLQNKKNFNQRNPYDVNDEKLKVKNKHKNLLINILNHNIKYISPNLKNFQNQKYYLISIKHFDQNKNKIVGAHTRATSDFKKVYKLINFLSKNKVIILGDKYDKSYKILKKNYKNKKNIFFFKDLSKSQSIIDQLFIHYYAFLAVGNASGAFIMSIYLKKKIIFFDTLIFKINKNSLLISNNIKNLYKKVIYNNKTEILSDKHVELILTKKLNSRNKYQIKENNFYEIKNEILNIV